MKSAFVILVILGIGLAGLLVPLRTDWIDISLHGNDPTPSATVLFGGDMLFDRYIRQVSDVVEPEYPLSCINPLLQSVDLVVANLEGPITDHPSVSAGTARGVPDNFRFTFPPRTAELLFRHNIKAVSVGNNHITNFGMEGVRSTLEYLDAADVAAFGDPLEHRVATTTVEGVPLAFIAYNQFERHADSRESSMIYHATQQIEEARAAGYLPIVFAHWGEEYQPATDGQRQVARNLIDNGAELVIGAHPHVIQEHELYQGKHIYYSLGNFIFDQYFSEEVRHGLLVEVQFSADGVTGVKELPITLNTDGRTCLLK